MNIQTCTYDSQALGRSMRFQIYGHRGQPILFIPCQGGHEGDFAAFGMDAVLRPLIDAGRAFVVSCDTIDGETWSDLWGDPRRRIEQHERWFRSMADELVPRIQDLCQARNGEALPPLLFGCSMGAMHAANFFFRRPELFCGVLALSGLYDARESFPGYMDDLVYLNSPCDCLWGMPDDHPYLDLYNARKMIFCVGQGAWEEPLLAGTRRLHQALERRGVHAWVDYWGADVAHDWPWWHKQAAYFLPHFLSD